MRIAKSERSQAIDGESVFGDALPAGVYGEGLITVTTRADARGLIESLGWKFVKNFDAFAYNAFGNLFLRASDGDRSRGDLLYYLPIHYGHAMIAAIDLADLLEHALGEARSRSMFLDVAAFTTVHPRLGPLPYGSVYTLGLIPALGGDGDLKKCDAVETLDVYLSIVGQSMGEPG